MRCGVIHMARQFFETTDSYHGHFKKTKKMFLVMPYRSVCTKYQVSIVFRLVRGRETNREQKEKYKSKYRNHYCLRASRRFNS